MRRLHGVVPTETGQYVLATMEQAAGGHWRLSHASSWNSSVWRNEFLLGRGVLLGLPGFWTERGTAQPDTLTPFESDGMFVCHVHSAALDSHCQALRRNVVGTVADDALLCSLPTCLAASPPDSFVSIFPRPDRFVIGVVIDKRLLASFQMTPVDPQCLPGHLARIRRYLVRVMPGTKMPESTYYLGSEKLPQLEGARLERVRLPSHKGIADQEALVKAVGVALAGTCQDLPGYGGVTEPASTRRQRAGTYAAAAILLIATVTALVGAFTGRLIAGSALSARQRSYQEVVAGNEHIQERMAQNRTLAERVVHLDETLSRQTRWAEFLQTLGKQRPQGLYVHQFGSEPVRERDDLVRIALVGWADSESLVTSFIGKLQQVAIVSNISLKSLERGQKRRSAAQFRIICTLHLYGS